MRFSRKFQIGDKVKVIKPNDSRYKQIGKITYYSYSYSGKGIYSVIFENSTSNYYSNNLEKVEDSSNTNTKPNKLSISELKLGMNTSENIELPLKEGQVVTLLDGKKYQVVKNNINKYACYFCSLHNINNGHKCSISHINNTKSCSDVIPHNHYFKLSEDQQTEDNSSKSLTISDFKIGMKIKVKKDFDKIVPTSTLDLFHFYHIPIIMKSFEEKELIVENIGNCFIKAKNFQWYPEWLEIIEESQIFCKNESALTKVSEETGIITKVTFTLNEFKSEKLEHSKFTIL